MDSVEQKIVRPGLVKCLFGAGGPWDGREEKSTLYILSLVRTLAAGAT